MNYRHIKLVPLMYGERGPQKPPSLQSFEVGKFIQPLSAYISNGSIVELYSDSLIECRIKTKVAYPYDLGYYWGAVL